jgi:hypothetical protein
VEIKTIGEYDDVMEAGKALSKIPGLPLLVRKHAMRDAAIIQTEKDFRASGLIEPDGNPEEKTHIEVRKFEGYNVKTKSEVEVDEHGKVVKLIDSNIDSSAK